MRSLRPTAAGFPCGRRIAWGKAARGGSGFTLIEVILIIVVIAILGALAILNMSDITGMKTLAAARRLQSDVTYAQELAMSRNLKHRVYFNAVPAPVPQGYAVVNDADGDGTWGEPGEFAINPSGGGNLSVTLNTGEYAGITLGAITFAAPYVEFNGLGVPSSGGAPLPGARSVTMTGGGRAQTVTVEMETGRVRSP